MGVPKQLNLGIQGVPWSIFDLHQMFGLGKDYLTHYAQYLRATCQNGGSRGVPAFLEIPDTL